MYTKPDERQSAVDIKCFVHALRLANYPMPMHEILRQKRLVYFFVRWSYDRHEGPYLLYLSHETVRAYRAYLQEKNAQDYGERLDALAAFLWHLSRREGFDRQEYFHPNGV